MFMLQGIIYSLLDKKKEADEQFETYRSLVPNEFPQRRFLDDVMLAAKTESREQLQKDFDAEFSFRKQKASTATCKNDWWVYSELVTFIILLMPDELGNAAL